MFANAGNGGGKALTPEEKAAFKECALQYLGQVWTNDFVGYSVNVYLDPRKHNHVGAEDVELSLDSKTDYVTVRFADRSTNRLQVLRFSRFKKVPFNNDQKPLYSSKEKALVRASQLATVFGVTNLLDETQWEIRSSGFVRGIWEFSFSTYINGYPSLYHVSIDIADNERMDMVHWGNASWGIPANLSTNVVLMSAQARAKAETYLKQYFPMKDIVSQMVFMTNSVEYVTPNYNYIRPADDSGFSKYVPPPDSLSLVWKNYFKKPQGVSFQVPVIIYVDAATGEMLGGSD